MDTKTLVVGQEVSFQSGVYGTNGTVVKVTSLGVDVQTHDGLLHFDNNGRSYVTELPSSYDSTAHPFSPWRWDGNGTYECGPWEIDWETMEQRDSSNKRRFYVQSLVIGQGISMHKGGNSCRSKVINITPKGIEVIVKEGSNVAKGQLLRSPRGRTVL